MAMTNISAEKNLRYKKIVFRHYVKEVRSTRYATHRLYGYPAKFIPHVIRFVFNKFPEIKWVFDPFAGFGSVAIEASIVGKNCILWDLNPMLEIFVKAATFTDPISLEDFELDWQYDDKYIPEWENLEYWHPKEFINELAKLWGYWHHEINRKLQPILAIPLLKLTKYFSYADLQISKLYKSKRGKQRVRELLSTNWRKRMQEKYKFYVKRTYNSIINYQNYIPKNIKKIIRGGVDAISARLNKRVDLLLTSPPYLQAHEYIRSFKLELIWLGYSIDQIRELQKKEIPYREEIDIDLSSKTYEDFLNLLVNENKKKRLIKIYKSYFKAMAFFFKKISRNVKNYIVIFVSRTRISNIRIPTDIILKEIIEDTTEFRFVEGYEDKILSRRLFKIEKNPATGNKNQWAANEYLLILEKET